jgi:hypothetical protein
VFRKKLAGVLDAPLPFLWNIRSDDMGIAVGFSVPATTGGFPASEIGVRSRNQQTREEARDADATDRA